jgi:hypothetical protein
VIRKTKHQNREYLIVDTELHIYEGGEKIVVPVQVQVNISKVLSTKHYSVYSAVNSLYNHVKVVGKLPTTTKKPWYLFWKSK